MTISVLCGQDISDDHISACYISACVVNISDDHISACVVSVSRYQHYMHCKQPLDHFLYFEDVLNTLFTQSVNSYFVLS